MLNVRPRAWFFLHPLLKAFLLCTAISCVYLSIHPTQPPSSHFIGFQTDIVSLYIQCKQSHFLTFSCLHPVSFCVPINSLSGEHSRLSSSFFPMPEKTGGGHDLWSQVALGSNPNSATHELSFNYHQSCYFVRLLDYKMGCQQHLPTGVLRTKGRGNGGA